MVFSSQAAGYKERFPVSDLTVIFVLMFAAGSLAIYGAYWFLVFNRKANKTLNRRLDLGQSLESPVAVLEALRRERGFREGGDSTLGRISDWLTQTGMRVQSTTLILVFAALCLALTLVLSSFLGLGLLAIILAVTASAAATILYLSLARGKRIFAFTEQLPDAIDVIIRGVRVGLPFSSAIGLVAREMPDPVGTEFGMLADELSFGLDLRTALENLYRRVGQEDLQFLTVSLSIQSQTGGSIAEILSRLSQLMRKRAEMRLKIRALSAEGRASALFLSAFPFLLIFIINVFSAKYFESVKSSQLFEPAVIIGLGLLLVGNAIMYRMVNFKY
jgi:tight adherence protein B